MNIWFIIVMTFCIAVHLTATCVVSVFAIKRVQYLSLAWVLGLITVSLIVCILLFYNYTGIVNIGILHPALLLPMLASAFVETIYPLGLVMPGYLQMNRMVKYAIPAILLIFGYFVGVMIVGHAPVLYSLKDIIDNLFLVPDVLIRLVALGLIIYYIIGIIRLPHSLLRSGTKIPGYLIAYCSWIGIIYILFVILSINFSWILLYIILISLTITNISFMLQSLETLAESLPMPKIKKIEDIEYSTKEKHQEEKSDESLKSNVDYDFNEANMKRFLKAEKYMQSTDEWMNVGFTRDTICRNVGYNRHLLLQSLRSQGYNNVHEYIATYRIHRLYEIIGSGKFSTLSSLCEAVGFSTLVTARSAYKKILNRDLDEDWNNR